MTHVKRSASYILSICVAVIACAVLIDGCTPHGKTRVLVIGTIHQRHRVDTNYTYRDINRILTAFGPDVIAVEIRPQDFRREPYLDEMMLTTIWGNLHGKKVYPIDYWTDAGVRNVRDSLGRLPEYIKMEERLKALEAGDSLIVRFERMHGSWTDQAQNGYAFWNGKEYNEYIAEEYRLSMEIYGDSPFNLFYRTRSDSMMALITSAVSENPGKRIMVLTGAEHKHYFDRALGRSPDVEVADFTEILPLPEKEPEPAIRAFLEEGDDAPYFEKGYPRDMNTYLRTKLVSLIHGPNMDFSPDVVPMRNLAVARKVIERWKNYRTPMPESDTISYEQGWIAFLEKQYDSAISYFRPIARGIEEGTVTDPFIRAMTHRNLGFCYDCIGERQKAVACYRRGEKLIAQTPFARAAKMVFQNYAKEQYRR